jgi:replicative DNA helicase
MSEVSAAIESEKTILGAILLDNSSLRAIRDILMPSDFAVDFHQAIYEAMIRLYKKHHAVDIPMLVDDFQMAGLETSYLYKLANECPSTNNIKAHAEIVREKSVQRQLKQSMQEVSGFLKLPDHTDFLAEYLEKAAANLRNHDFDDLALISLLVEITNAVAQAIAFLKS